MLEVDGLSVSYGGVAALDGVSLRIPDNSITAVLGPNGAGKSTILRVLSGLLKPRLGEITFDERSLVGLAPRQILALGIVQVPQSHSLFPGLTVRENVRLGAYMLHDTALVERRLSEVEEMFPIVKTRARDKAGSLSGGQQRLVEFARCLMVNPRLIMLDEPSMGLDPKTFKQVIETIKTMQSSGRTIVLVEQNARTGLSLANNGVVLESGRVRLEGSHDDILHNPEIGRLYLGGTLSNA